MKYEQEHTQLKLKVHSNIPNCKTKHTNLFFNLFFFRFFLVFPFFSLFFLPFLSLFSSFSFLLFALLFFSSFFLFFGFFCNMYLDDSDSSGEEDEDEEEDVVVFASDYWKKYRKAIMLMLKDQSSRKSRMEAVLALARISNPVHAKMVLRRLFPPVCKKPLIRSVAVWRLLSLQWRTLLDTP